MHYSVAVVLEVGDMDLLEDVMENFNESLEFTSYISKEEFVRQFKESAQDLIDSSKSNIKEVSARDDGLDYTESIEWFNDTIKRYTKALKLTDVAAMVEYARDNYLELETYSYAESLVHNKVKIRQGNLEGRWDWYVIGGRWRGQVLPVNLDTVNKEHLIYGDYSSFDLINSKSKKHVYPDGCYIKDISEEHVKDLLLDYVNRVKAIPKEKFFDDKDTFVSELMHKANTLSLKEHLQNQVAAYVTLDGKWVEEDIQSKTLYDYLMANKDAYVIIVDIHC